MCNEVDFELADMLTPQVTVVTQDPSAMGRMGAELVFARLADPAATVRQIEHPMELVVRGSEQGTRL